MSNHKSLSLSLDSPEVIVIDDDDDDKETDTTASTHLLANDEDAVACRHLQQIFPHFSHNEIVQEWKRNQGNVAQTADALLRKPSAATTSVSTATTTSVTIATKKDKNGSCTRLPSSLSKKRKREQIINVDRASGPFTKRTLFGESTDSKKHSCTTTTLQPTTSSTMINKEALSPEWYACYERAKEHPNGIFVDPDFGPMASSLDGRSRAKHHVDDSAAVDAVQCRCGFPAAARQVQSDGPNYGRFYLSCGRRQKRRPAVAAVKANDPVMAQQASPTNSPRKEPCNFFQWDPRGLLGGYAASSSGAGNRFGMIGWHAFGTNPSSFCLYKDRVGPDQVQQGAIGNCWFLSALAVVVEKPYLVQRIIPHTTLNDVGCYQVNLCLDGQWRPVTVDAHLPVIYRDVSQKAPGRNSKREGIPVPNQPGVVAIPAFCATPQGQLWPALVEKAYAKAHGSYAQLSGGFIQEGLMDLTGAPCETIIFERADAELLWARLLSFAQAGFCMGIATAGRSAQRGLVSCHAYSVLDVIQIDNVVVGDQAKLTEFFGKKSSVASSPSSSVTPLRMATTIRLVHIRNPWGSREWKGNWSAQSDQWTHKLRQRLPKSWRQGDGTFFMSYQDMLQNFHHMDVCKTQPGWYHSSVDGLWSPTVDPLRSSRHYYRLLPTEATHAYISIVQPKKRANTHTTYWYADPSLVILERPIGTESWTEMGSCNLAGIQRITTVEVFLDPRKYEYLCVPFGCHAQCDDTPYRLAVYSEKTVQLQASTSKTFMCALSPTLRGIHCHLLDSNCKSMYPLCHKAILVCRQISGGCYFLGVNASPHFVSVRLTIDILQSDILPMYGDIDSPGHDLAPGTQKILLVLSGSGKSSSTATRCPFRYASSIQKVTTNSSSAVTTETDSSHLGAPLPVSKAGRLLAESLTNALPIEGRRGTDTLDTYDWIPQIGSL